MSAMDNFTALKRVRDTYASLRWTAQCPQVRLFYPDDGSRTREYTIEKEDVGRLHAACSVTEHEFSSDISYAASYELGDAVKRVVLYDLDKRLKALAAEAEKEAREVLAAIAEQKP